MLSERANRKRNQGTGQLLMLMNRFLFSPTLCCRSLCHVAVMAFLLGGLGLQTATPAHAQQACQYDSDQQLTIDPSTFIRPGDPTLGNPQAEVTVVEFFDPNCPPCRRFHPTMEQVIAIYADRVHFYRHPVPLWEYSLPQIEAMLLAARRGKYDEMIDLQLINQQKGGLPPERLAAMAGKLGLDEATFARALKTQQLRNEALQFLEQAQRAGVKKTPSVAIGQNVVASSSQSVRCIGQLIERELSTQEQ